MIAVSIESVKICTTDETQIINVDSPQIVSVSTLNTAVSVGVTEAAAVINPIPENYGLVSWDGSTLRIT